MFEESVMVCEVNREDVGLLVERKGSPEMEPLRSEGEAKGPVLDLL